MLAFLAGALATFALAPYDFPAVGFVSFPLLVWLLDGATPAPGVGFLRRLVPAFSVGWGFGFGYFVGGLWWLGAAMLVGSNAFLWAIPLAVLVLPAIVAVYFGLAAALARLLWSGAAMRILALAASFALFEYLRGVLFTGFPWNAIGLMATPVPLLMQSAALIGLDALTFVAVFVFASPALLADGRRGRWGLGLAALLLLLHVGYGAARLHLLPTAFVDGVRIRIVQPNIEQMLKWDAARAEENFRKLLSLTRSEPDPAGEGGADASSGAPDRTLVVWPETAFPFILTEQPGAVAALAETLRPGETLIAGAARIESSPTEGGQDWAYNSIYAIDDTGTILDAVDKVHLVPFGEYLPYEEVLAEIGLTQLVEMPGGFTPGAARRPVDLAGVPPFIGLVCYEIIFPGEIDLAGDPRPEFIVNVTNDAWYGETPGPYQHLRHAQLTAVQLGLPLIRSANTGVSIVADAQGRIIDGLGLSRAGIVEARLPVKGPITVYSRLRDWIFWLVVGVAFLAATIARARTSRQD